MKKILYSFLIITMAVYTATAQIKVVPTPAGAYLNIGKFPSPTDTWTVSRDMGKGFEVIANLRAPTNKAVLYQRMKSISLRFPNYYPVSDQLAQMLIQNIQMGKKDSILKADIPVMLLGLGAAFLDTTKNLPEGTKYQFELAKETITSLPLSYKIPTPKSGTYQFYELNAAAQVIRIEWRTPNNEQPPLFVVQRKKIGIDSNFVSLKTDLGFEKTKIGDSLSVHLSDTTVSPGISYHYLLIGKDYLGNTMAVSDTIRSIAGNRTSVPGIDRFTTKIASDSSGILLQWSKQNPSAIRSIRILRSAYYDSTYVQVAVLAPTDSAWIDKGVAMGSNYYYQVVAQGQGDFAYPSPRVFGSFVNKQRLLPPTKLTAIKNPEGTKLTWRYATFMNLLGFRMYRALGNSGKFLPISPMLTVARDTMSYSFIDKDKSLSTGEFYTYAVAAIGRNNIESPLSAIAQFNYEEQRKLTTPRQLRSIILNDSTVSITWQDLSAIDHAITGYQVFRKSLDADSTNGFQRMTSQPITNGNEWIDTTAANGIWQYVVQAVNDRDSSTMSLPLVVRLLADKPLPPGKVQLFAQKNSVIINWDGSLIPHISKYNIYRATATTMPVKIGEVNVQAEKTFEDKDLRNGNLFYYYITTETTSKVESDKSKEVSIRLK